MIGQHVPFQWTGTCSLAQSLVYRREQLFDRYAALREPLLAAVAHQRLQGCPIAFDAVRPVVLAHQRLGGLDFRDQPRQRNRQDHGFRKLRGGARLRFAERVVQASGHPRLAIEELAAREGIDLAQSYAYSDSESDLPMLQTVGHPVAVNPDAALARVARESNMDAIRYESVRDPEHGAALAVLRPSCFKPRKPLEQHTWFLTVRRAAVIWQREGETFEFDAGAWRQ